MNPVDIYLRSISTDYANFKGRARRSEFWIFNLFSILLLGLTSATFFALNFKAGVTSILLTYLALLIPSLSVFVRRLHDTGKTGWLLLLTFVPFGNLILLIFACIDGDLGENKYGPDPKEEVYDIEDYLV